MNAAIRAIEYHLPSHVLTNTQLSAQFPEWAVEKIEGKTGIVERRIAAENEFSSDLAFAAAQKLLKSGVNAKDIDYVIFCTQSPDYILPTTACILQDRLGIPTSAGAIDYNLGCSGYVYGLGLAKGLIETGQARNVLFLTGETYSKFIHPQDKSVRTLFGDAGAATLISAVESHGGPAIGPFVYGSNGASAEHLIVRNGGMRHPKRTVHAGHVGHAAPADPTLPPPWRSDHLHMKGREIFAFTMRVIPGVVQQLLERAKLSVADVDHFVFHQANQYMLGNLREKLGIPPEKFVLALRYCGNTVSNTIPIALKTLEMEKKLKRGNKILLVGFGVGASWGATMIRWQ